MHFYLYLSHSHIRNMINKLNNKTTSEAGIISFFGRIIEKFTLRKL